MIKLAKLVKEIMDVPPANHIQYASTNSFSNNFVEYMKTVENSIKKGRDKNGRWLPYQDPAGWHIGYGHLIKTKEELQALNKGISDADVDKLLKNDLAIANKAVQNYIKQHYKVDIKLTQKQSEMLIDFAYNLGGLEKFPKFADAVLRNQTDIIKKEYIRKSGGKELTGRNKAFYNRFLK